MFMLCINGVMDGTESNLIKQNGVNQNGFYRSSSNAGNRKTAEIGVFRGEVLYSVFTYACSVAARSAAGCVMQQVIRRVVLHGKKGL